MITTTGGAAPAVVTAAADVPSVVQSVDWLAIAPVVITAAVGLLVLIADLFLPERRKPLLGWISVAGLAAATAATVGGATASQSTDWTRELIGCLLRGAAARPGR